MQTIPYDMVDAAPGLRAALFDAPAGACYDVYGTPVGYLGWPIELVELVGLEAQEVRVSDVYFNTSDEKFEQEVLKSDKPTLVDFWAPWCGPCLMMAPAFESLAQEYQGRISFAKIDTDENPETPSQYGIMGIPTLIIFKGGKEVDRLVGLQRRGDLQRHIEGVLEAQEA